MGGVEEDGGTGGEGRVDEIQPLRLGSSRGNDVVSTSFPDALAAVVEGVGGRWIGLMDLRRRHDFGCVFYVPRKGKDDSIRVLIEKEIEIDGIDIRDQNGISGEGAVQQINGVAPGRVGGGPKKREEGNENKRCGRDDHSRSI